MGMEIYDHLGHYTQTTKNTKYHSLQSLWGTTVAKQSQGNYARLSRFARDDDGVGQNEIAPI
jgi:hypothetical protein